MLTFTIPAGCGDASFLLTAGLAELSKTRKIGIKICDGEPRRTAPFIEILPNVEFLGYILTDYESNSLPITTDLSELPDGEYKIQANTALERGFRIEKIFPHQKTNYHYQIDTTGEQKFQAVSFIDSLAGSPRLGIYCSSHNGIGWNVRKWVEFCEMLRAKYPNAAFYCLGAKWDNRTMDVAKQLKEKGFNVATQVGEHHIGTTIEVIKRLSYFFCFPSGLGILADVVSVPCLMPIHSMFPQGLINSYADPEHITNGFHINAKDEQPAEMYKLFLEKGAKFVAE